MSLSTLDIALRAGATALLLVLAASLFRDFRGVVAGRLAVSFALGSAAHAVTYVIGATAPVSLWHAPLIAISTGNIVVFWLFTRALFDDAFEMRLWHLLLWAAVAGFSFVNCAWIAPTSAGNLRLSLFAINLLVLGFIALAVGQTIASWSADLVEGRRRLRLFIVSATALYGGMNAILQMLMSGREVADAANTANAALLAGIVAAICYSMMRVNAPDLFTAAPATAAVADVRGASMAAQESSAADQRLVDALMRLMADERIYRHDNITIGTLATKTRGARIQIAPPDQPAARLSQLQCLPQQSPHRGSQGRSRRSVAGRGARDHHCDGCRLSVAGSLQSRLQGHHRRHADRIPPSQCDRGLIA
jgi:hypothetical protein